MTALTSLKKLTKIGRAASGVTESAADMNLPYQNLADVDWGNALLNQTDVALIGVSANDLAVPVDKTGAPVGTVTPVGTTTYASNVFKTQGFGRIVGTAFSDTVGTLTISQSNDGTHFDQADTVALTASTGSKFSVEVVGLYAKVGFAGSATQVNAILRIFPLLRRLGSA